MFPALSLLRSPLCPDNVPFSSTQLAHGTSLPGTEAAPALCSHRMAEPQTQELLLAKLEQFLRALQMRFPLGAEISRAEADTSSLICLFTGHRHCSVSLNSPGIE